MGRVILLKGRVIEGFRAATKHAGEAVIASERDNRPWLRVVFLAVEDRHPIGGDKPLPGPKKTGRGLFPHPPQFSQMTGGVKIPKSFTDSTV